MKVLVSAASKHGSTAEIAGRIAEVLRTGLPDGAGVDVRPAADTADAAGYDAVVLGSAVYMGHRLDRHRLGFAEKAMVRALRVADGDFRDWDAIERWARHIAAELSSLQPAAARHPIATRGP